MEFPDKFVDFFKYCPKCAHGSLEESTDVCNECLHEPTNVNSSKPVKFEEK